MEDITYIYQPEYNPMTKQYDVKFKLKGQDGLDVRSFATQELGDTFINKLMKDEE